MALMFATKSVHEHLRAF